MYDTTLPSPWQRKRLRPGVGRETTVRSREECAGELWQSWTGSWAVGPRYSSLRLHFVRRLLLSLAIIENYASKSRKMHTSAWSPRTKAFVSIPNKHAGEAAQRAAEDENGRAHD